VNATEYKRPSTFKQFGHNGCRFLDASSTAANPLEGVSPINATPKPAGNFELFEKINITTLSGKRSAGADGRSAN